MRKAGIFGLRAVHLVEDIAIIAIGTQACAARGQRFEQAVGQRLLRREFRRIEARLHCRQRLLQQRIFAFLRRPRRVVPRAVIGIANARDRPCLRATARGLAAS